jgi:hypothetical protein
VQRRPIKAVVRQRSRRSMNEKPAFCGVCKGVQLDHGDMLCAGPDRRQIHTVTVALTGLQLDSFLPGSSFPVVFAAQPPRRAPSRKATPPPGLRVSIEVASSSPLTQVALIDARTS